MISNLKLGQTKIITAIKAPSLTVQKEIKEKLYNKLKNIQTQKGASGLNQFCRTHRLGKSFSEEEVNKNLDAVLKEIVNISTAKIGYKELSEML